MRVKQSFRKGIPAPETDWMELKTSIAGSKRIICIVEQLEIILVRYKNIKIVLKVVQFGREAKTELGSQ